MELTSLESRWWNRFPELKKVCERLPLSDQYYQNGGLRSPYNTFFDDLSTIAKLGAIVAGATEQIVSAAPKPQDAAAAGSRSVELLMHDVERLRSTFHAMLEHVRNESETELGKLLHRLSEVREELHRQEHAHPSQR